MRLRLAALSLLCFVALGLTLPLPFDCSERSCYDSLLTCNGTCSYDCSSEGSCARTHITCPQGTSCSLTCGGKISCSGLIFDCSQAASCALTCSGEGSCGFITYYATLDPAQSSAACSGLLSCRTEVPCSPSPRGCNYTCGEDCYPSLGLVDGYIQAMVSRYRMLSYMRYRGLNVDNVFITPDGDLQLLLYDETPLPSRPNAPQIIREAVAMSFRTQLLQNPPIEAVPATSKAYLARLGPTFWVNWLNTSSADLLERRGFPQKSSILDPATHFGTFVLHNGLPLPLPDAVLYMLVQSQLVSYTTTLLSLPEDCFQFNILYANSTEISFSLRVLHETGTCALPGPFWGACCKGGVWYSSSRTTPLLQDLAASSTPIFHNGSLALSSDLLFQQGNVEVTEAIDASIATVTIDTASLLVDSIRLNASIISTAAGGALNVKTGFEMDAASTLIIHQGAAITLPGGSSLAGTLALPDLTAALMTGGRIPLANMTSAPKAIGFSRIITSSPQQLALCTSVEYSNAFQQLFLVCPALPPPSGLSSRAPSLMLLIVFATLLALF